MVTNPEPDNVGTILDGNGPVVNSDSGGPEPANLFEMERRVPRISLEQTVILVGELPDFFG